MNLDEELQSALRRQPPRGDLAPKVLARLRALPPASRKRSSPLAPGPWPLRAALAVVVILAAFSFFRWRQAQQVRAHAAAQQLVAALHLASSELTAVRAKVVRAP